MKTVEERNKALIRRYGEEHYNHWNEALAFELVHENVRGEFPGFGTSGGIENYLQWYRALRNAFPDCHFEIDWMVAEGELVAVRWSYTGTHHGRFMGLPATGRRFAMKYNSMYRIVNGKIIDIRSETDTLKFFQALGYFSRP